MTQTNITHILLNDMKKNIPVTIPLQISQAVYSLLIKNGDYDKLSLYTNSLKNILNHKTDPNNDYPAIFYHGNSKLFDYREHKIKGRQAIVMIPSLVNRATILNLTPQRSMTAAFLQHFDTFLLDWGDPDNTSDTISYYIFEKLLPAIQIASIQNGGKVHLIGCCMGGIFAAIVAVLAPHLISSITLLATPWDFRHMIDTNHEKYLSALIAGFKTLKNQNKLIPSAVLQTLFLLKDQKSHVNRYTCRQETDNILLQLEDWIQHGQNITAPVMIDAMINYYQHNKLFNNQIFFKNNHIDFNKITCPIMIVSPTKDTVVPPESALGALKILPKASKITPNCGHIGMIIGKQAPQDVWNPLKTWLEQISA